ncbi:nucleic acid-binding, OB-fold protein [Tanacetum coccineum]
MQDAIRPVPKLNCEQRKIYDPIMNALIRNEQELLFVYGHGGTGKTFIVTFIVAFQNLLANCKYATPKSDLNTEQQQRAEVFAKCLLDIGNGETGEPDNEDDQDSCWISIPPEYCVSSDGAGVPELKRLYIDQTTLENTTQTSPRKSKHYLGCIRSISDITPFGDANKDQGWLRKVDIENLDGNVVEFTMWDDLAKLFNKEEIEKLPRPIIIVVSSCRVSKYRDFQLSPTSATYYYINPQTPKAEYAYTEQTLHTLIQQNLETFPGVRFTCEATITSVAENRSWNYSSCSECNKKSTKVDGIYTCEDDGIQEPLTYRYNFKATVSDATAVAYFTFFTKAGEKIIGGPCSELVAKYKSMDQRQLPIELVKIIGKTQIFQIHFTPSTRRGSGQFTVVDILDIQPALETEQTGITLDVNTTEVTEESTSKDKYKSGTPPREVIEEVAGVVVSTIPHQKPEIGPATKESGSTPSAPRAKSTSVKRAILQEQSPSEKKKHE